MTELIVITAAHCFEDFDLYPESFTTKYTRIVPGLHIAALPPINQSFSEWGTTVHEIHQIYEPSTWNQTKMYHDMAILIVKTPFVFNSKIQPIKLDFRPQYENKLIGMYI